MKKNKKERSEKFRPPKADWQRVNMNNPTVAQLAQFAHMMGASLALGLVPAGAPDMPEKVAEAMAKADNPGGYM